jgi:hypothetical protein
MQYPSRHRQETFSWGRCRLARWRRDDGNISRCHLILARPTLVPRRPRRALRSDERTVIRLASNWERDRHAYHYLPH